MTMRLPLLELGDWAAGIKAVTGILIPKNNMQKLSQNWEKSSFSIILAKKTAIFCHILIKTYEKISSYKLGINPQGYYPYKNFIPAAQSPKKKLLG